MRFAETLIPLVFWNKAFLKKTIEIFSLLPLINNSVTIGLIFFLLSISAIISSNTTNITNTTKIYQFKTKYSIITTHPLYFENI